MMDTLLEFNIHAQKSWQGAEGMHIPPPNNEVVTKSRGQYVVQ